MLKSKKYFFQMMVMILILTSNTLLADTEATLVKQFEQEKNYVEKITKKLKDPKNTKSALQEMESYIAKGKITPAVLQSKILYSTYVLDKIHEKKYVTKAISYMMPLAIEKELAAYQFVVANLLFLNAQYDLADAFLQLACTNDEIDEKTEKMCNEMTHIENSLNVQQKKYKENIKGGASCQN